MSACAVHKAAQRLREQREWMDRCGGTLRGYVLNYGSEHDEQYYGEGGEHIYAADLVELFKCERALEQALERQSKR
jgi:hypothetical protein